MRDRERPGPSENQAKLGADVEFFQIRHLVMVLFFLRIVRFFYELCDPKRFQVNCAKSHHRVISDGLT